KTYFLLGAIRLGTDQMQQSEEAYRNAIITQNKLIAEFPSRPEYQMQLASAHNNLGGLLSLRGEQKQAEAEYKEAVKLGTQLVGNLGANSAISQADLMARLREYNRELAVSYNNLGAVSQALGRLAEAQSYRQRAVKLWSDMG